MLKLRTVVTLGTLLALAPLAGCTADRTGRTSDRSSDRAVASVVSYSPQAAPSDVREQFRSRFPDAQLISVLKRTYRDGTTEYEAEYREDGQKRNALIATTSRP
jgi:hypothetical protein